MQNELLKCKNEQLESVQSTVQTAVETSVKSELKSYSEAVGTAQKPVAPAFQSVKQAVQQVVREEDRSRNFFVFGLEEENNENTGKVVDAVLESIGEKPRHDSVRIGVLQPTSGSDQSRPRPIKVSVSTAAHVFQVLKAARMLKSIEQYTEVFIHLDRSLKERELRRKGVAGRGS